ncbi:MAG: nicotinate (nicotinamide) nucleotide adenylyltransferase [Chlamydiae bacterium]|nr:nicotinate (nicotinamide) nucleotide adenylyltransferase [Chlamydiota bacterium]
MHKKSIGFFGGSFDPVHCGHIHLALSLMEKHKLSQILFCPAFVSPFKTEKHPSVSALHRQEMVKLAIKPIPFFSFCDYELQTKEPSFTIDTIKYLKNHYKSEAQDLEIRLILGDDSLEGIASWKDVEELLELAPPLIGSRNLTPVNSKGLSSLSLDRLNKGLTEIPILDISSTLLRGRLKRREYCGHLIPSHVLEYIHQNKLYE